MKLEAALIGLGLALFAAAPTPAAAQWRNYDGYQVVPAPRGYYYAPYYYYPDEADDYPPPRRRAHAAYQPPADPYYPDSPYADPRTQGAPSRVVPEQYYGGGAPADRESLEGQASTSAHTAEVVANPTKEAPGTIVVDTRSKHLYLVRDDGQAIQYGIGVGRQGFEWKGTARIARKAEWPKWTPPVAMLKRRPDLPTSMEGGLDNPLGARALYLFQGDKDTLFRIHGTNEPETIGKAVSSGCIRMMNADVIDLYKRVPVGTKVVVI